MNDPGDDDQRDAPPPAQIRRAPQSFARRLVAQSAFERAAGLGFNQDGTPKRLHQKEPDAEFVDED